jgi:hypothetical protein
MLGIRADDPHDTFAADDFAVLANPPDAASHFHDTFLSQGRALLKIPANRLS